MLAARSIFLGTLPRFLHYIIRRSVNGDVRNARLFLLRLWNYGIHRAIDYALYIYNSVRSLFFHEWYLQALIKNQQNGSRTTTRSLTSFAPTVIGTPASKGIVRDKQFKFSGGIQR